ncbi:hypothetical protein A3Q56_07205, partial [Intoshia linei]
KGGFSKIINENKINHQQQRLDIDNSFQNLSNLMENASKIIDLSNKISNMIGKNQDDDLIKYRNEVITKLGIYSPTTKSDFTNNDDYFQNLAKDISNVVCNFIESKNGIISFTNTFYLLNRARSTNLCSPNDFVSSAKFVSNYASNIIVTNMENGLKIFLDISQSSDAIYKKIQILLDNTQYCTAYDVALCANCPVIMALEK